jgi:hypothetical protein
MIQPNDPKNGPKKKRKDIITETSDDQLKASTKKESTREERDTVPIDKDARQYFDAEDEDQELSGDTNRDIPL